MKVKGLKALLVILASCFMSIVLASGWSGGSTIQMLYPSPGNNGVFVQHGSMPNPDSCSSPSYYLLSKDNAMFDEIYTLLVSAQARNSKINLQLSGCGGENNLFPLIYQVIAN